jgi:phospholipid/cholesterol/gamma-HCH transport system permease protein
MAAGSMTTAREPHPLVAAVEALGRGTIRSVAAMGQGALLLSDVLGWIAFGRRRRQPVRAAPIFSQAMEIGILALPIVSMLAFTIGVMLAIQGIDALRDFGAEHQVTIGVALSVTREFAPLITGILVAGRSGSALAARLGTMTINEEMDALRVMGINPVRYLVVPALVAMVVMLPALTLWADFVALAGAGLYVVGDLGITWASYLDQLEQYLSADDVLHGLAKAAIFAVLITLVAAVDGSRVRGGAEGVGRATTHSVVHAITALVLTDMLFALSVAR